MRFQKGQSGNPAGRPKKATSLRELLLYHPIKDKKQLVETAYRYAIAGDHNWANWIARTSGEVGTSLLEEMANSGGGELTFTITMGVRGADDDDRPALPEPLHVIESEAIARDA